MTRRLLTVLLVAFAAGTACTDDVITPPAGDVVGPSIPANVTAMAGSNTRIDIAWSASSDNVAVTGYKVFRDGALLRTVADTLMADSSLTPGVLHCYAVAAVDAAKNESSRSPARCAATINQAPVAALAAPAAVLTDSVVTFDAGQAADADGTIVEYTFRFGDGSPDLVQTSPVAQHTYTTSGAYQVALTVKDNHDAASTLTREITIGLVMVRSVNVSRTPNLSREQWFAIEPSGAINAVWLERGADLVFARSTDGGVSFSAPTFIVAPDDPLGATNGFYSGGMNTISVGDTIHVAWTVYDVFSMLAEVFHARSTDGGLTFSPPLMFSANDAVNSVGAQIVADGSGLVVLGWDDANLFSPDPFAPTGAVYSRSTDGGRSFVPQVLLAEHAFCPAPALFGQHVYFAWSTAEGRQVLVARSTDRGANFSPAITINSAAARSWCPRIVADAAGSLYVVWTEGEVFNRRILFSQSADAGLSFSPPVTLSPSGVDAACPGIALGAGRVYVNWSSGDFVTRDLTSVVVFSADGGESFAPARYIPVPGAGCFQMLPRGPDEIDLGWDAADPVGGLPDVYYGRARISPR